MISPDSSAASEPARHPEAAHGTPSTTADWPIREYVADDSTAQQVARGYLRDMNKNPILIAFYALLVIAAFWAITALTSSWVFAAIGLGATAAIAIGLERLRGSRGRTGMYARKLQPVYGAGLRTQVQLREKSLWIRNALSEGTNDYSVFKTAIRNGDAVLIKTGPFGVTLMFPGQLFSEEDLTELQRRIAAANVRR